MKKDYRNREGVESYWLYGKHPVTLALGNPARKIKRIVCTKNGLHFLKESLSPEKFASLKIEEMFPDKMDRLIGSRESVTHQGLAAEVIPLEAPELEALIDTHLIVATDKITDPHNIGAIMRSAAAFGASALITQERNSPPENATIAKVSAGAVEMLPYIRVNSLWQAIEYLKEYGFKVVGLDGSGNKGIGEISYERTILVVGSEGSGLSPSIIERCDDIAKINMKEGVESLNASVAAAISLYELSSK